MMRLLPQMLLGALAGLWFLFEAAAPQTATDTGVYVDLRTSEAADAPVSEPWKLYGASYALVVGIDDYTNGWPRLSNAVKDAALVAKELRARGFEVELLTNVTSEELRTKLRRFFALKGADPEARLFVWFAGHGYTESGEGYLVPADAPPPTSPEFFYHAVHMGDVGSMVRIAKSKHVLAVFDSCFAGTIFSAQRARPPVAITRAVRRPVRQFLTSGDAEQQVSDDGTFRTLFLRALRGEETADANRDGYLTGTELSFYLEDRMINLTQGLQTPHGGKLRDLRFDQGDFVFLLPQVTAVVVPEATAPPPTPASPSQATLELEFWNSIKESDNSSDYQAYLEAFPEGTFAPLAQVRMGRTKAETVTGQSQAAAPGAASSLPQRSPLSEGQQTAFIQPTVPAIPDRRLHPYDGNRSGYAHVLRAWCGIGKSRFELTLRVENGRISGGDSEGFYKARGRVDQDGWLKNAYLNQRLVLAGSLTEGTFERTNSFYCRAYELKRVED